MSRLSLSVVGAAALLASAGSVGLAQGHGHGGGGGGAPAPVRMPEVRGAKPAKMDHESAMGAAHEGMKGDKDRTHDAMRAEKREDDAAGRAEKRQDEVAGRAERRQDRMEKRMETGESRAERDARRDAHDQSRYLLRGVKLGAAERSQVRAIDKRYELQLRTLRRDEKAADKSGTDNDAAFAQRIAALAAQERADIRAVLSPAQQARFDANISARASRKH